MRVKWFIFGRCGWGSMSRLIRAIVAHKKELHYSNDEKELYRLKKWVKNILPKNLKIKIFFIATHFCVSACNHTFSGFPVCLQNVCFNCSHLLLFSFFLLYTLSSSISFICFVHARLYASLPIVRIHISHIHNLAG